jgi:hypothetical protein
MDEPVLMYTDYYEAIFEQGTLIYRVQVLPNEMVLGDRKENF